jgi:hypothetical protein
MWPTKSPHANKHGPMPQDVEVGKHPNDVGVSRGVAERLCPAWPAGVIEADPDLAAAKGVRNLIRSPVCGGHVSCARLPAAASRQQTDRHLTDEQLG